MQVPKESLFITALRSFLRSFCALLGIFLAIACFSFVYSLFSGPSIIEEKTTAHLLPDASDQRHMTSLSSPAILQINIHGAIGIDLKDINSESAENILLDSRTGLLSHGRVKAILLHINSPGGTVVDSDNIYRMLQAYKKRYNTPIFAYVDGLCASGGMYIASAADKIFASPSSAIGSVGVIYGPFFNVYNTLGKIGIEAKTLTEGLDKDTLNPTRPWKEGEDQWIKDLIASSYERFLDVVTSARPRLSKDRLVHVLGARMFDPSTAQTLGYIDVANTSRSDALLALMQEAGIDSSKPYQVVELESKKSLLGELIQGTSPLLTGKIEHSLGRSKERRHPLSYLYQPQ